MASPRAHAPLRSARKCSWLVALLGQLRHSKTRPARGGRAADILANAMRLRGVQALRRLARIEPPAHLPPGLEGRFGLLPHQDGFAIARVARGTRVLLLDREHAKVAQLHPVTPR